jgi:hypothetical protein
MSPPLPQIVQNAIDKVAGRDADQEKQRRADPTMERDSELPPSLSSLAVRWVRNVTIAALVVSVIVHVAGFGIAKVIRFGDGRTATAVKGPGNAPVAMAIMAESELSQLMGDPMQTPALPEVLIDSPSASTKELTPAIDPGPVDAGELSLSDSTDFGALTGGGNVETGPGGGLTGSGGGGGGGTAFFGVESSGTRFIFIVDVSSSMAANNRIERLKEELRKTLRGMADTSEFAIVMFSDFSEVLGGSYRYAEAKPSTLRKFEPLIDAIRLGASTEPLPAFEIAFNRTNFKRPDAVYFMTDGEFADTVDEEIAQRLNTGDPRVPIHCICFGNDDGQTNMKQIAKDSGGTYTFVP